MIEWVIRAGLASVAVYYVIMYYRQRDIARKYVAAFKAYDKLYREFKKNQKYVRELEKKLVENATPDDLARMLNSVWVDPGPGPDDAG